MTFPGKEVLSHSLCRWNVYSLIGSVQTQTLLVSFWPRSPWPPLPEWWASLIFSSKPQPWERRWRQGPFPLRAPSSPEIRVVTI